MGSEENAVAMKLKENIELVTLDMAGEFCTSKLFYVRICLLLEHCYVRVSQFRVAFA